MKSKAKKIFGKDNIFSLIFFFVGCLAGAAVIAVCEKITMNPFLFCIICGLALSGTARIFFPYSQTDASERKQIDAECKKINGDAFRNRLACRRKLESITRLYHNNQFRRALKKADILYSSIRTDSERFAVCFWTALCCFELRFFEDARDEFLACLSVKYDENAEANLADCYMNLEEYSAALDCFTHLNNLRQDCFTYLCGAAICCLKLENYTKAFEYSSAAIELSEATVHGYVICLTALTKLGDNENYNKYLLRALSADADFLKKHPIFKI